ncbi:MAG TPA: amidohydrolase family protein, partial [Thermoanaerobaculia bacterium]|nr:amidohydrolase family protein [Thermoanaerobaculia bacterium]
LEALLAWRHTNLCTDGALDGSHPRGFGTYPRVLGRYVRERGVLGLEEAVRRMTALAADHVGIADRGRLVPGAFADLVLLDPSTVIDRATTSDPHELSVGIERVWVNGRPVFAGGAATGLRPGRVLRRSGAAPAAQATPVPPAQAPAAPKPPAPTAPPAPAPAASASSAPASPAAALPMPPAEP